MDFSFQSRIFASRIDGTFRHTDMSINHATSIKEEEQPSNWSESGLYTLSLYEKGTYLQIGPMTSEILGGGMTSYYSTTQHYKKPTLQPTNNNSSHILTYGGDKSVDWMLAKTNGMIPTNTIKWERKEDNRTERRTWDHPWNRGCPGPIKKKKKNDLLFTKNDVMVRINSLIDIKIDI